MQIENIWASIMAFALAIAFGFAFYGVFSYILGTQETDIAIFLGVITGLVFVILAYQPITALMTENK